MLTFIVFAPTDAAFAKLPSGIVEELLKPENKAKLVKALTSHVVPGKVMSSVLQDGTMVKTVEGTEVTIKTQPAVTMGDAKVTQADLMTSNGVIHVIDKVLMPKMRPMTPPVAASGACRALRRHQRSAATLS